MSTPSPNAKPCTLCHTPRQILIRCQIDATQTWHFVCPGACWRSVSGGEEDARGMRDRFPHYRYGGMWKNRHADGPVSARKPRGVGERQRGKREEREGEEGKEREEKEGEKEGGQRLRDK